MSHIDASQLATYNSLLDPHLAGYFTNVRRRKHLMKAGLVTRKGEIVSETTYRLSMARKEHKKHVRDLLAQAIVHKTLDMERSHQVEVRKKIEEISKIELVRRVRSERGRHGDEEVLPYLSSRPRSNTGDRSASANGSRNQQQQHRAQSAPADRNKSRKRSKSELSDESLEEDRPSTTCSTYSQRDSVDGRRSRKKSGKKDQQKSTYPKTRIDDRHLYSLNQAAIRDYTMSGHNMERYRGPSPYTWNQMPVPPKGTPRTPNATNKNRRQVRPTTAKGKPVKVKENKGYLMIHRPEPAMKHQERVQTLCEVTLHYFGSNLKLDYEKFDPRDDILVEQQHCGGNTLPVFDDKVLPGNDFTFTSRRHRGYPFSLAIYINHVMDCRLSVCCEYKHKAGSRLGGKLGHFGIVSVDGKSTPCYRCQVNENDEKKKQQKKKKEEEEHSDDFESCTESDNDEEDGDEEEEEEDERKEKSETKVETDQESDRGSDIKVPVEKDDTGRTSDSYSDDDFEGSEKKKEKKRRSSSSSSSGSSRSSSSSSNKSSRSHSSSSSDEESTARSDKETKPKKMENTHMEKSDAMLSSDEEEAPSTITGDQSQKHAVRSDDKNTRDQSNTESDSSREGDRHNRIDNGSKVTGKENGKDMAQEKLEDLSDSELSDLEKLSKQKPSSFEDKQDVSSESETDNKKKKAADAGLVDKDTDESNTSERSNTDNDTARSDDKSSAQQKPPTSPPEKEEFKFYPSTSDSDAEGGSPTRTQQTRHSASSSDSSSGKAKKTKQGSSSESGSSDRGKKTKQESSSDSSSSDRDGKTKPGSTSSSESDRRSKKARNAMLIKQHRDAAAQQKRDHMTTESDTDSQPGTPKQAAQEKRDHVTSDTDSQPDTPKQAAQEKENRVNSSSGSDTETERPLQKSEEKQDKKSFSSSTSDSGSETDTETDKRTDKNKQTKAEDTKQDSPSVTGSDSSDDTMSGGYDRDRVADREEPTEPRVQTPTRVQPGSIRPLVEGKQEIVINNLALTKMQMSEMADILEDSRQVDALYLRNCDLDDDAVKKLAEALTSTPDTDLKVLNLNCNKLSPTSVQHILKIVKRKHNLEMLLLHGNTLGDAGAEDLCQGLVDIHKEREEQLTTKAEELQAIRSTAHSVVSDVMSDVMKSDSLDSLKVPDSANSSEQSDGSIAELVGSVEKDSRPRLSIQHLDLGDCRLKRAGAEAVAKLISANIGISNLCLTGNRDINTRGWKAIAEALKTNKDIEVLSLDHNNLENRATSALADCLQENDSVVNIDLEGNKIGNRGGKKILEMVKVNRKVKDITLTPGNSISKDILAEIEKTLVIRRKGK